MADVSIVVGVIFLRLATEWHFYPAIGGHRPALTIANSSNVVQSGSDERSWRIVKPANATIATAVTVIKAVSIPVQNLQGQSSFSPIFGIIACMILASLELFLLFSYRQGASWFSLSAANSGNCDSFLETYSYYSTPPNNDSSYESSGSGGHRPPFLIFDHFYAFPISHLDKVFDIGDEQVRDDDGAPPLLPPSFPTPVEVGDAFKSKPSISRWLFLTLVLSITSFITRCF